jgi:hypothetical protein
MYVLGIVIGLLLAVLLTWRDFEASSFELARQNAMLFARYPDQGLDQFSCPLAITRNETAEIKAKINNPYERTVKTVFRASITDGSILLAEYIEEKLEIAPGESVQFSWPVQASDAAWGRFVMARAFTVPSSPLPAMASYCGILVIDLPFLSGNQILGLAAILGLGLLIGGWVLWISNLAEKLVRTNQGKQQLLTVYALLIIIGASAAAFGNWMPAAGLLLINTLLTLGIVSSTLIHRK